MNKNTVRNKVSSRTSVRKRKGIGKYFLVSVSNGKTDAVKRNTYWRLRTSRKRNYENCRKERRKIVMVE